MNCEPTSQPVANCSRSEELPNFLRTYACRFWFRTPHSSFFQRTTTTTTTTTPRTTTTMQAKQSVKVLQVALFTLLLLHSHVGALTVDWVTVIPVLVSQREQIIQIAKDLGVDKAVEKVKRTVIEIFSNDAGKYSMTCSLSCTPFFNCLFQNVMHVDQNNMKCDSEICRAALVTLSLEDEVKLKSLVLKTLQNANKTGDSYDASLLARSLLDLTKGWDFVFANNQTRIEYSSQTQTTIVGLVGWFDAGKSWLLSLLTGLFLSQNISIPFSPTSVSPSSLLLCFFSVISSCFFPRSPSNLFAPKGKNFPTGVLQETVGICFSRVGELLFADSRGFGRPASGTSYYGWFCCCWRCHVDKDGLHYEYILIGACVRIECMFAGHNLSDQLATDSFIVDTVV